MCLLALFFRAVEDAPFVVGTNREELYTRGGEPPRILDDPCHAVAGVDPQAGGTWLGINERGVLVAITNRLKSQIPPQPRSRGLLVGDLLCCASAASAAELAARELDRNRYGGCNIVCVDRDYAVVLHGGDWLRVRPRGRFGWLDWRHPFCCRHPRGCWRDWHWLWHQQEIRS